ncbi:hypothetical protein MTBBW1_60009 [Desulfamplus magnetovallimortis]|uniref:Uncharacterized protein n=1 Tax=Desulfamplus magnetovallimortis TaxID=1246637 RepID=A0A1W1HI08_9BACT|nr:hypothetical protein MTBBW1_60009 [Desulfamplus magnetovallimortis]
MITCFFDNYDPTKDYTHAQIVNGQIKMTEGRTRRWRGVRP